MPVVTEPKLISGNANKPLARAIARRMSMHRGMSVGLVEARVERFNDQEVFVEVYENVRGEDMFIVQSTSNPANDNLMELLIMADALRRSSAARITAVIPYFGYARQDRRAKARTPISAKLVANMIAAAGIERVLTMDLHAAQIQGFFDIPVDNLYASPIFSLDILHNFRGRMDDLMVVSPDVGGVARARELAKRIGAPLSIVDKRREKAGEIAEMTIIGEVAGKTCLIVDDICGHRRHPVQGGAAADGARGDRGALLHHPRRPVGSGGRADREFGHEIPRHHRLDRASARRPGLPQHPDRAHGARLRAGDPEHLERNLGLVAVRARDAGADLRRHVHGRLTGTSPPRSPAGANGTSRLTRR
ncbi:ribose-phosphate pyrophosphokinase [Wenxinia marina DSM 24838]|uniref:Ribose-phosphate pyrophosphokinase n=1 Tax=Wenxinia marina DSM 24838 TaxID=1123501 RepID=A0A0D0QAN2_9RHOB|nr:ribose-phosphate pyrophosphokinase [Wenxinia marina DSM 24838]